MSDEVWQVSDDNDLPTEFLDELRLLVEKHGLTAYEVDYMAELSGDPVAHFVEVATVESRRRMTYDCGFSED